MRYSALSLLVAVVLQSPVLLGQAPQPPGVTFQVEVNYVDVDVVVTDEQGQFVTGLTRDDFEVFEDGKPQKIDTFSLVDIPVEKPAGDRRRGARRAARHADQPQAVRRARLRHRARRSRRQRDAQRAGTRRRAPTSSVSTWRANDLGAVVYTSGRSDAAQEFTTDRELLIRAIDKFQGRRMRSLSLDRLDAYYQRIAYGYNLRNDADPNTGSINSQDPAGYGRTSDPTELERGTRALNVLDTLKNTAEFLGSVRGRRKAVLFFSEGLDFPIRDVFGAHDATVVIRATQDAISTAARANVNYYTIDPRGLAGMTTDFMESAGIGNGVGTPGPVLLVPGTNTPVSGITGASGGVFNVAGRTDAGIPNVAGHAPRARRADRRFRVGQHQQRRRRRSSASSTPTAVTTCSATIRRLIRATAGSTRSKCASSARACASKRDAGYASPRGRTPEERKRDEAARLAREARPPDGRRTSTPLLGALTSPIQQSGLDVLRAGGAVQEHSRRSVNRACDRDRRQPSPVRRARTRRVRSRTRSSCRSSASTSEGRRCRRAGRSSTSRSVPKRATA